MSALAKRVVVLGLDCAAPQLVFERFARDLPNLQSLMAEGLWGDLTSVVPAITVPAWACAMTSRDPGQLGIYGFRNRKDYSYQGLSIATSGSIRQEAVWDVLSRAGRQSILLAVPPSYPPKPVNGSVVGCFLTPSTKSDYTFPASLRDEIASVVGDYAVDVEDFRTEEKDRILSQIRDMTVRRFQLLRHLLKSRDWDFAMMVEIGVDRIHHGFWQYMDEQHHRYQPGNQYQDAIRDYYRLVDEEIGGVLRELDDETAVLVISDHGAKLMRGGICVNEWLRQEGLLTLKSQPTQPTRFSLDDVDWSRTRAWGEGGYYGRVFLNVRGREPEGVVAPDEYEALRDELAAKLTALRDEDGNDIGTRVFKPQSIYRECRNIPPDLIVYFGDLDWRSVASVGTGAIHTYENDTGPDDANHAQEGIFIMKAPGVAGGRRVDGLQLVDCGPTILRLLGQPVPEEMIGRALV